MSLTSKLAEVMAAVERIPKNGHNAFHHYDYATDADILSAIRLELAKRQVMLLPAVTAMQRDAVGEKGQWLTTLIMEMTFMDGESGETITRPWLGAGTDKEDKGAYKAMTGGEKYFLLKTFLIATGDDPEATEKPAATTASRPVAVAKPAAVPTKPAVARPEPPSATHTRVKAVDTLKTGKNARGPWALYKVVFADGREATTLKSEVAIHAKSCRDRGVAIEPELGPGFKSGEFELLGLVEVLLTTHPIVQKAVDAVLAEPPETEWPDEFVGDAR